MIWLGGCAAYSVSRVEADPAAPDAEVTQARATPIHPGVPTAPPAGHRLSQVAVDMTPEQVQEILGAPAAQASYPTARTYNPYAPGNDSGNRIAYKYAGEGRVVFAVPKYGGEIKVLRVDYDPSEDGT